MPKVTYSPSRGLVSTAGTGFQVTGVPLVENAESLTVAVSATATLTSYGTSTITATGNTGTITVPDGTSVGQQKLIVTVESGGHAALSVLNHETSAPEAFTSAASGDNLLLVWLGSVWATVANNGYTT